MKLLCGPKICLHESKLFSKQLLNKMCTSIGVLLIS